MRPRIGITCSTAVHDERNVAALETAYVAAIERAGGTPYLLPILDPALASDALVPLDGLVLAGGGDVEPALYGAVAVPEVAGVDRSRDVYEIALLTAALATDLPVLGICRGLQVVNVALGGTLVQDVPTVTGVVHRDDPRAHQPVHPVAVVPGSELDEVLGATSIEVNSLHHQAVDVLGRDLVITARSDDATVEGIASTGTARLLGVQWHPELLPDEPASRALFAWLVDAATRAPITELPGGELGAPGGIAAVA